MEIAYQHLFGAAFYYDESILLNRLEYLRWWSSAFSIYSVTKYITCADTALWHRAPSPQIRGITCTTCTLADLVFRYF